MVINLTSARLGPKILEKKLRIRGAQSDPIAKGIYIEHNMKYPTTPEKVYIRLSMDTEVTKDCAT